MKKCTCKGGKIRFKLGNEVKEYYATDIEIIATTGNIKEQECEACERNKPKKKKRRPKKTAVKVQKVDLDIQKGGDGSDGKTVRDINNQ